MIRIIIITKVRILCDSRGGSLKTGASSGETAREEKPELHVFSFCLRVLNHKAEEESHK